MVTSALLSCRLFDVYDLPDTGTARAPAVVGTVYDIVTSAALVGVEVCVWDHADLPCGLTDGDGRYRLEGVPVGEQVQIAYRAAGYHPSLHAVVLDAAGGDVPVDYPLFDEVTLALFAAILGVPFDPALGMAGIEARDGAGEAVVGVAITVVPLAGLGPFYVSAEGIPDPSLTATEAGMAAWIDLPGGRYAFDTTWAGGTCAADPTGWVSEDGRAEILVVAGYASSTASLRCTP